MQPNRDNKHNETGKWGEQIVAEHLTAQGYAIIARNWRLHHFEIDIVASKGDIVAFVEVKTRFDGSNPLGAITPGKVKRMAASANAFMQAHPLPLSPRFDVAAISGSRTDYRLDYIPDAFRPPLRTYR